MRPLQPTSKWLGLIRTPAAHPCARIAKRFLAAAAHNQQRLGLTRTLAALVRKNRKAILGGGCTQPAMLRTHSNPDSTLRKNRKAILGGGCIQPTMTRTHSDPGSTLRKNRPSDSWRCCSQPAMLRIHLDNGSISWHNMSACTVSPCSGRGQRSRIRQAHSGTHRRNRSRIFQGSFRFRRFRFHAVFP